MVISTASSLSASRGRAGRYAGFTLIELLITLCIFMIVCAMAIPALVSAVSSAKYARAVADVHTIGYGAYGYYAQYGQVPNTLADCGYQDQVDPWGRHYVYLGITASTPTANLRTDQFGVTLNTFFDLYSMGPDGQSDLSLADPRSQDDVIWANDGQYLGWASSY